MIQTEPEVCPAPAKRWGFRISGGETMGAPAKHRGGWAFNKAKREMFALYGHTCHICGHEGALQADHLDPLAYDPEQPVDAESMRPAHGAAQAGSDNPCPTCGRRCNQERGKNISFTMFQPALTW